jgi:HEAT repeat protein
MPIVKHSKPIIIDIHERERPRDMAGLIAELEHESPIARRWAARDLAEHEQSSEALIARLKREADPSVRDAILTTLTSQGNTLAVQGLVDCLRSEDAALRNEAIEVMKLLPEEVALIMNSLLTDSDSDVRIFAVNILESLCHPQVETWLIDVIEQDAHVNVCATAVDLLGEVGTSASRAALMHLKAKFPDEPYICFAVDLALKRISED